MEREHRQRILRNLVHLSEIRNPDQLITELVTRNVFSQEMIESIQASNRSSREQVQKLFLDSCKRGPKAFGQIVDALMCTDNVVEARLLDPTVISCDNDGKCSQEAIESCDRLLPKPVTENSTRAISAEKPYRMTSNPVGFALVINVVDFDGNPDLRRDGADKDALNLSRTLKQFGFEVFLSVNPKKKDLLCRKNGIIKTFTDRFTSHIVDSCVVAIMSHGEDNFWIQTSDCESMADEYAHLVHLWDDILLRFNNHLFPTMRDKPKLFIIHSCRGDRDHRRIFVSPPANAYHYPSRIRTESGKRGKVDEYEQHPEFNHMILLQSTIPGYVTIRHEEKGSPFIQILCQVFKELGSQIPLADMIPVIARKLQDLPTEEGGPQTCTFKTVGYVRPFQFVSIGYTPRCS